VPVEWLMEAAGWQVARHCEGLAVVVCGHGNNGGDGLAAARHLHRWGRLKSVACTDRAALKGPAALEAEALEAIGVEIRAEPDFGAARTIVDALLGTGLSRPPGGKYAEWIQTINSAGKQVLAVDVPSGLETDTGKALDPTVRADLTVTLGLPKPGLRRLDGPGLAGTVWVVDIGIPFEAYAAVGAKVPHDLYSMQDQVRLA